MSDQMGTSGSALDPKELEKRRHQEAADQLERAKEIEPREGDRTARRR